MVNNFSEIKQKIDKFIKDYLEMDIMGTKFNCPYWANKLVGGQVAIRGFLNGKGDAAGIRMELEKLILRDPENKKILSGQNNLNKFAKRNRIGIDCSGIVFRILTKIVNLSDIFKGGINKTNARMLTSPEYNILINSTGKSQIGDMIRINGGRHVAVIVSCGNGNITYVHSSYLLTQTRGVHLGKIQITDQNKGLEHQKWLEKTKNGENFAKKFYLPGQGDGVYRLKIFPALNEQTKKLS